MIQILTMLNYPLLRNISIIATIAATIIGAFQRKGVNNDIHTVHHILYPSKGYTVYQKQNQSPAIGCFLRCLLYISFFVSIAFLVIVSINPSIILTPTEQAQTLVQNYYDDINNKDYQSAYDLLKTGFSPSYNQFVKGYADTEHNDISFDGIVQLPNGNIQVMITIKAIKDSPAGKYISTYYGAYIIGKDDKTYKILSGSLSKLSYIRQFTR